MTEDETTGYVRHQMQIAELVSPVFADSALQLIYKATQGIPRLISHICTYALFDAERRGSEVIEDSHIGRILADLEKQRGLTAGWLSWEPASFCRITGLWAPVQFFFRLPE